MNFVKGSIKSNNRTYAYYEWEGVKWDILHLLQIINIASMQRE